MSPDDPKLTWGIAAGRQAIYQPWRRCRSAIAPATWEYDSLTVVTMAVRARPTGPANAAHCGQAFVVRLEPAIAGTAAKIVMGAPVRCSGFCDAKRGSENSDSE